MAVCISATGPPFACHGYGLVVSFILSHTGSPVNRIGLKCVYPGMNGFSCSFHVLTGAYPVSNGRSSQNVFRNERFLDLPACLNDSQNALLQPR
jgi:hypothetical protein